jgi:hypothetical protein
VTTAPSAGEAVQQDCPFPPAPVEELLRLFVKAVRAHQLYLPNNPVYKGAVEAVRAAFPPIWAQTTELTLAVTETEIRWFGRPVLSEAQKSGDSLPWTFYKDGLRELQLAEGFEGDELVRLFDILQRVRKASPEEDDLLTMLWEADFARLRYRYVDLGAEAVTPLDAQAPEAGSDAQTVSAAAREVTEQSRSAVVNMQDFDATLYFLDDRELAYLREEIEQEYSGDLRRTVIATLLDIFEAQTSPDVRAEVSDQIETLMLLLLAAGQLKSVAYLLAETQIATQRANQITAEQIERLGRLPERMSAPEPLGQLLQALDESADPPPLDALTALFQQLRPTAMETIFAWIPRLQSGAVRSIVEQAADRLAAGSTGELARLITSQDRAVAAEAVRRAGAMKSAAAVAQIARLLAESPDAELRRLAVQALTEIGSAGALQALERSIEDSDREVRVAAVRTLGAKAYRGVFQRLESVVKAKELRGTDLTEKMAFFEAYGSMCGDAGVAFLDRILNGKGTFGKREDPELRACAAMALGRVGSKKALEALQRASGEKDIVVRNAISRALRPTSA